MNLSKADTSYFTELLEKKSHLNLVIVDKSDAYPAAHFRLAILVSLTTSMGLYFFPWSFSDPIWYLYAQIPALLVGYFLASKKGFKRFFSTSSELHEESYQKAIEYYYEHNLKSDLLFISLLEKKVHLINFNKESQNPKDDKKVIATLAKNVKKIGLRQALENYIESLPTQSSLPAEPAKEIHREESQTLLASESSED